MPLILEGGRIPPRWMLEGNYRPAVSSGANGLNIALINNMPDAALEDTELQFFGLLDDASVDIPIYLKLYSLTGIPRTERGQRHVNSFYYSLEELWPNQFDGVIITGTEPRQPNLQDEPYWGALGDVFDWAEQNTSAAILSCLAAHAGVLHCDRIPRHRLPDKQFGVFEFTKSAKHSLISGTPERVRFPHSRWNEVQADELTACGYTILTQSPQGGVDSFVKQKRRSLFLHFQGHPEYGAHTLLKEYRRDIRRFINKERETYPSTPVGYFEGAAEKIVADFRNRVLADGSLNRQGDLIASFPDEALNETLQRKWDSTSTTIYSNWLQYIMSKKAELSKLKAALVIDESIQRKGCAQP